MLSINGANIIRRPRPQPVDTLTIEMFTYSGQKNIFFVLNKE
jgi:hypothetical protein